ncbi:MAG TPA: ABC transporter ATPase [Bacteroidia bacterium]|nr:ABC transporter ATPase [Bacteroidia bacterium]
MYTPLANLPGSSKVWVYQASEVFDNLTAKTIEEKAKVFVEQWTAHDQELKAGVEVLNNLFLVIAVDEGYNGASGCSVDKKVRFIQSLESQLNLHFFDRMRIAWKSGAGIRIAPFNMFGKLLQKGEVGDDTVVYNNLVADLEEFRSSWEVPFIKSWHRNLISA